MVHHRRTLLFGIDAATLTLIRPWVEQGHLPILGGLMASGAAGSLRSVPNMMTPAAWTSLATGCNPAKHGIFYFTERIPDSYEVQPIKGSARAVPPFWALLSRHGVTCSVVNMPMTFPADRIKGVMVSGMDAPAADAPGFTQPPDVAAELRLRFGRFLDQLTHAGAVRLAFAGQLDAAREMLEDRVQTRTELARYLMEHYPCDCFALVHPEVDGVQHCFWKFIDPRVPGYSSGAARRYADGILRVYQKVDQSLDTLMTAFGPANVMVVSDHGAGAALSIEGGVPWIRLVLEEMGLAVPRVEHSPWRRASKGTLAAFYRFARPRMPWTARRQANRWVPGARRLVRASTRYQYDWARTRAFCMGAPGEVWLNLRGRDPLGLVEPGPDYDQTRHRIRDQFLALRDAHTGEPIVEAVSFREDLYHGPFLDRAPDLYIAFRDVVITAVRMHGTVLRLPRRAASAPKEVKSGSHRPDGLLILAGTGIRQGVEVTDARLLDIAPTLLYWLGCPVPSYMDGRVLTHAFTPEYTAAHPVTITDTGAAITPATDAAYSSEDAALVMERLRRLGYV